MKTIIWSREMTAYLRENSGDKSPLEIAVDIGRLTGNLVTAEEVRKKIGSLGIAPSQKAAPKLVRMLRINGDEIPYSYASLTVGKVDCYVVALLVEPYWIETGVSLKSAAQHLRERYAKWARSKWRGKSRKATP